MIGLLLSFNNVNAFIPIIVIGILILAAVGLTRGGSIFDFMGVGTFMGLGGGIGSGRVRGLTKKSYGYGKGRNEAKPTAINKNQIEKAERKNKGKDQLKVASRKKYREGKKKLKESFKDNPKGYKEAKKKLKKEIKDEYKANLRNLYDAIDNEMAKKKANKKSGFVQLAVGIKQTPYLVKTFNKNMAMAFTKKGAIAGQVNTARGYQALVKHYEKINSVMPPGLKTPTNRISSIMKGESTELDFISPTSKLGNKMIKNRRLNAGDMAKLAALSYLYRTTRSKK